MTAGTAVLNESAKGNLRESKPFANKYALSMLLKVYCEQHYYYYTVIPLEHIG